MPDDPPPSPPPWFRIQAEKVQADLERLVEGHAEAQEPDEEPPQPRPEPEPNSER